MYQRFQALKLLHNLVALGNKDLVFSCLVSLNHDISGARLLDGRRSGHMYGIEAIRAYGSDRLDLSRTKFQVHVSLLIIMTRS
jgi:hypothetical protein